MPAEQYSKLPEAFKALMRHDDKQHEYLSVINIKDWPERKKKLQQWREEKDRIRKACIKITTR